MSVYVDDCFQGPSWGRWQGGGHMQADTPEELHAFAERIGLKRSWFQKGSRPEMDHYDLTRSKRKLALAEGAVAESLTDGTYRRRLLRQVQT